MNTCFYMHRVLNQPVRHSPQTIPCPPRQSRPQHRSIGLGPKTVSSINPVVSTGSSLRTPAKAEFFRKAEFVDFHEFLKR
jgi:hypothetical protein